jgi:hypothetical protein
VGRAAKLAFAVSLVALNVYFAWTSLLLQWLSPWSFTQVDHFIRWQDIALFNDLHLNSLLGQSDLTQVVADFEALAAFLVLLASTAWLSGGGGYVRALLRTLQVGAFCLVLFGIELALFNYGYFYLHVTDAQVAYNVIPWFNNADMLLCGLLAFGTTTMLSGRSWRRNSLTVIAVALIALTAVGAAAASQSNAMASAQAAYSQSSTQDPSVASSFHTAVAGDGLDPAAPLLDNLVGSLLPQVPAWTSFRLL